MIVVNGNIMSRKPREFAGDRPALTVASWPVMLRAVAEQLARKDWWLSKTVDEVARDWGSLDAAINIVRLKDILAHSDLLTGAQVSRVKAAVEKLQERS